jgi:hypothetical protein
LTFSADSDNQPQLSLFSPGRTAISMPSGIIPRRIASFLCHDIRTYLLA